MQTDIAFLKHIHTQASTEPYPMADCAADA